MNSPQQAEYNAYYESQLPLLREEHPGLKLSQYKERIFEGQCTIQHMLFTFIF